MLTIGLFAGIGGIELGLHHSGMETTCLAEIMPEARCVLSNRFPSATLLGDVTQINELPKAQLWAGGFPCQDLSIAGKKIGILGSRSSLVHEIFRLLKNNNEKPDYILIENVANLISLNNGEGLNIITQAVTELGYQWAYRLVDPRSFGIPQRRPRLVFLASKIEHPKNILFPEEDSTLEIQDKLCSGVPLAKAYGFYWTEGKIGIGWAKDSIPPLKCGSTLGLPSSPAIWDIENNFFGTPCIEDAERLQGFPAGWTDVISCNGFKDNSRWKLVGNAVNIKVSEWIGKSILFSERVPTINPTRLHKTTAKKWPKSAFSDGIGRVAIDCSPYPLGVNYTPILDFLDNPMKPLSLKATLGFLSRVQQSTLIKYPAYFIQSIRTYLKNTYDYDI